MDRKILHVVDISPCVYAGSYNTHSFIQAGVVNTGNGYRERRIPTGGTSMLFNILGQYMGDGPIMFVADRNPTIKKERYPSYKGCRTHPHNVSIEKEVAEYILRDCGFTIYAEDGYEADDVIYNIVEQNKGEFDHVYVHTADSDLYIVVDENVTILPTSSRAKTVTLENYSYTCKKGKSVPYNSVVFQKFLDGDSSKNLYAISREDRDSIERYFTTPKVLPMLGFVQVITTVMAAMFPQYSERLSLFYPLLMDRKFSPVSEGRSERIREWAYEIGNKKVPAKKGELSSEIAELIDRALYLE